VIVSLTPRHPALLLHAADWAATPVPAARLETQTGQRFGFIECGGAARL